MNCDEARSLVSAYLDDELDAVRSSEMHAHLAGCSSCRAALETQKNLSSAIRQSVAYQPAPASLRARFEPKPTRFRASSFGFGFVAATILLLALWRPWTTADLLPSELIASHVRSMMATHLVDVVSTDRHTVKPWFQGKLDFSPTVVDLASVGFPLEGGRLDFVNHQPVAALVYHRRLHTINVFVMPHSGSSTQALDREGFHVRRWVEGGLDYWAVSDVSPEDLAQFESAFKSATR